MPIYKTNTKNSFTSLVIFMYHSLIVKAKTKSIKNIFNVLSYFDI